VIDAKVFLDRRGVWAFGLGCVAVTIGVDAIETLLRSLAPLKAAALMPKIALRGTNGLLAIRLKGKKLALEIGLLRLSDSGAKSAVGAFTRLAQAAIPKMIASSAFA